jgi:hypothetical protein
MRVERVHRHGQGSVDAVGTGVRADGVSMREVVRSMGDDDRASSGRAGCAPFERVWLDLALIGLVDKGWRGAVSSVSHSSSDDVCHDSTHSSTPVPRDINP